MITARVSSTCYANVTYVTEVTPRMGNRKFICGLNPTAAQLVVPVIVMSAY